MCIKRMFFFHCNVGNFWCLLLFSLFVYLQNMCLTFWSHFFFLFKSTLQITCDNRHINPWACVWWRCHVSWWHVGIIWQSGQIPLNRENHQGEWLYDFGSHWWYCWFPTLESHYWTESVSTTFYLYYSFKHYYLIFVLFNLLFTWIGLMKNVLMMALH